MAFIIDRRRLMGAGLVAGLLLPARGLAQLWPAAGFTHSVASGEPKADSVLLWTRYAGKGPSPLRVEIAERPDFGRVVARAEALADPANDGCARATLTGLQPRRTYFYRFTAPDGTRSDTGRTRTLPAGRTNRARVAVFSCANKGFGFFNAYGHAAARDDLDLVIHTGDYIYEYPIGGYPSKEQMVPGRDIAPATEIVRLDDYRQRYASYRVDKDLQALHRRHPVIAIWDDHEFTNDAWRGGAQNHQPDEGDWEARKRVARQAHTEWLPVSGRAYDRYEIGDLVTLLTLDTRIEGRDEQFDLGAILADAGTEPRPALERFRDGRWRDPARTLLGEAQERWTADALRDSVQRRTRWQFVAQQLVMSNVRTPPAAAQWIAADASERTRRYVAGGVLAGSVGLPQNLDSWGGYTAARSRFLRSAQEAGASLVVTSGDSHNAWAGSLVNDGKPAGVEFAGQSVTSPGFEQALVADPAVVRAGLVGNSDELKWCDTSNRGYLTLSFDKARVEANWLFSAPVRKADARIIGNHRGAARRGANVLSEI